MNRRFGDNPKDVLRQRDIRKEEQKENVPHIFYSRPVKMDKEEKPSRTVPPKGETSQPEPVVAPPIEEWPEQAAILRVHLEGFLMLFLLV